ncbi:unnamed protein product [Chrysoparadoxa australica]
MWEASKDEASQRVAREILQAFTRTCPDASKKFASKWTVVAGVWCEDTDGLNSRVLAVGTGTRCLARGKMNTDGTALNDSHAEVICRRSLVRVMAHQVQEVYITGKDTSLLEIVSQPPAAEGQSSLPGVAGNAVGAVGKGEGALGHQGHEVAPSRPRLRLKPRYKLHMYISQAPCGDASIYPRTSEPPTRKLHRTNGLPSKPVEKHRHTGAHAVVGGHAKDGLLEGLLRTKPGRSDLPESHRTLSHSCSDKLVRWSVLGLQGRLLGQWIEPLYLTSLVIGSDEEASVESLESALSRSFSRAGSTQLRVRVVELPRFPYERPAGPPEVKGLEEEGKSDQAKRSGKRKRATKGHASVKPSPLATSWGWLPQVDEGLEVTEASLGKRQGMTKKTLNEPIAFSRLCKASLLQAIRRLPPAQLGARQHPWEGLTYAQAKELDVEGTKRRDAFFKLPALKDWIVTDRAYQAFMV